MSKTSLIRPFATLLILLTVALGAGRASAGEITDMGERRVTVPDSITRVYGASPPVTYLIYAIDPALLVGLNYGFGSTEQAYLRGDMETLPVIGGWFGQGKTPNLETLLKVKPDVMIAWMWTESAANEKIEKTARGIGLPLVMVKIMHLADYPEALLFLGKLLHREERCGLLADYARRTLERVLPAVGAIPEEKRVSVYYAEGRDGLSTDCDQSSHTEVIRLAGGRNIYRCPPRDDFGMERISMEQIMLADPQVIVAQDGDFVDKVYEDPQWRSVRAVKEKKVFLIPRAPFNWLDRPPSFMRLLGVQWLTHVLYPDLYPFDAVEETRSFYRLFLGVELDDAAVRKVLKQ